MPDNTTSDATTADAVDAFLARWQKASGSELANYQLFVTELTALLGLPPPDPASADDTENAYVFERRVTFRHADGSSSSGRIDCYRRACYVLESKQSGLAIQSTAWDAAMLKAHAQGSNYARALPPEEGRPPFLLVTDVGRHIGVYADFTRSGANYIPFPDALSHRIYLDDLRQPAIRERLRAIWLDPLSLDPARRSARVTRAISAKLAELAKSLEAGSANDPEQVAGFLMRCLFTMFAEDVGLLPERSFSQLLKDMRADPAHLPHLLRQLWADMNTGSAFSGVLRAPIPHFNGGLFAEPAAPTLSTAQIDSARCWSARSTPWSATSSAPTTRRAPTWSGSCCPPSSSPCARTGPTCRPAPTGWTRTASATAPSTRCAAFTGACAPCACWTPPAAAATFST